LRAESFSCRLDVLYRDLVINKFFSCEIFKFLGHLKVGSGSGNISGSALKPMRIHNTKRKGFIHKRLFVEALFITKGPVMERRIQGPMRPRDAAA
jgi:hypothetical protein